MRNRAAGFVNSEPENMSKEAKSLTPHLELLKPIPVPEVLPFAPVLEGFDFSTPPWLLTEVDGFLDVNGVIPIEALDHLGAHWITDRRNARRRSEKTLNSYEDALTFLTWFLRARNCSGCGETELYQFLQYCRIGHTFSGGRWGKAELTRPLSDRTIAIYYSNLRAFFNWSVKNRFLSESPLARIESPQFKVPVIKPFSKSELDSLLWAAKESDLPHRNMALLSFLYDTGLREDELCQLALAEIDWKQFTARILHGKGDKERTVIFNPDVATLVWDYLRHDKRSQPSKLFLSQRGTPLTPNGVYLLFKRLGRKAGITGTRCSPHTMRHTFATHAIENGATEDEVRRQLGHTTTHMTKQYVELTGSYKCERHQSYSPYARYIHESSVMKQRGRPRRNW